MIFDRMQNDVDEAMKIREKKVKTFQTLTKDEKNTLERGMLTINTLNRIEDKQASLVQKFNEMGYWNINIKTKSDWTYSDIFTEDDFKRIISNEDVLENAFFVYSSTPNMPEISFHYDGVNALEKILYDLDMMAQYVEDNYRVCGDCECGE